MAAPILLTPRSTRPHPTVVDVARLAHRIGRRRRRARASSREAPAAGELPRVTLLGQRDHTHREPGGRGVDHAPSVAHSRGLYRRTRTCSTRRTSRATTALKSTPVPPMRATGITRRNRPRYGSVT